MGVHGSAVCSEAEAQGSTVDHIWGYSLDCGYASMRKISIVLKQKAGG